MRERSPQVVVAKKRQVVHGNRVGEHQAVVVVQDHDAVRKLGDEDRQVPLLLLEALAQAGLVQHHAEHPGHLGGHLLVLGGEGVDLPARQDELGDQVLLDREAADQHRPYAVAEETVDRRRAHLGRRKVGKIERAVALQLTRQEVADLGPIAVGIPETPARCPRPRTPRRRWPGGTRRWRRARPV